MLHVPVARAEHERDRVARGTGPLDVALAHRRRHDGVLLAVDEQRRDAQRQPRRRRCLHVALGVLVVRRAHEIDDLGHAAAREMDRPGLRDGRADPHRRVAPAALGRRPERELAARREADDHDALAGREGRRATRARRSRRARPPPSAASRRRTSARRGGTRGSRRPSRGAAGRARARPSGRRRGRPASCRRARGRRPGTALRRPGSRAAAGRPTGRDAGRIGVSRPAARRRAKRALEGLGTGRDRRRARVHCGAWRRTARRRGS